MKTFEDLQFKPITNEWLPYDGSKQAEMIFPNGYSILVGIGMKFNSSENEYEVQIFKNGERFQDIFHWSELQYCEQEDVTRIMRIVQQIR